MPEYVYSIVLIVAMIIFFTWWTIKKRNDVWKGELLKKNYTPGDYESSPNYYLVFKTDEGKKKRFNTPDEKYWSTWNEGDRAEKKKGQFFPSKVE